VLFPVGRIFAIVGVGWWISALARPGTPSAGAVCRAAGDFSREALLCGEHRDSPESTELSTGLKVPLPGAWCFIPNKFLPAGAVATRPLSIPLQSQRCSRSRTEYEQVVAGYSVRYMNRIGHANKSRQKCGR
jgi:hypothetical protein